MNNIVKIINQIESLPISDKEKMLAIKDIKKMTENVAYAMLVDFDIFADSLDELFIFSQSEIEDPTIYNKICKLLEDNELVEDFQITNKEYKILSNVDAILQATAEVLLKAKELNGDWTPDWNDGEPKYFIYINNENDIDISWRFQFQYSTVFFKDAETAQKLIDTIDTETLVRYLTHNV